jgi:hypothetical protein
MFCQLNLALLPNSKYLLIDEIDKMTKRDVAYYIMYLKLADNRGYKRSEI